MFLTICRLCLKDLDPDDTDIRSILDKGIQKALKAVFPFKIVLAENLPMYTCKQCTWNVSDFYCYSELVQKNQKSLEIKLLPQQKVAQKCDEDEGRKKKNTVPNTILKPTMQSEDTNITEEHLITCKAELDDVHVANEPHPDMLDYSFENFDQCNTSITCEDYKITPDIFDNVTECPETVAEEQVSTHACENNSINMPTSIHLDVELRKRKRTTVKKSNSTSYKLSAKPSTLKAKGGEISCLDCQKTFPNKRDLKGHKVCHENETCAICKKTFRRKNISRHMYTKHSVINKKSGKTKTPIELNGDINSVSRELVPSQRRQIREKT